MNLDANAALEIALEAHRNGRFDEAAHVYHQILNHDPSNANILFLLGDLHVRQGHNGMAINLLSNSAAVKPMPAALNALGCACKHENFLEEAEEAWLKSVEAGETTEVYNNLASLHADSGRPEKALEYVEKSLALEPANPNAHWNKALALLTARRWREAWPEHEHRFNPEVQKTSVRRDFGVPQWNGEHTRKLAVHGEQGIGDEIMFLSMLQDAIDRCDDVVVEVEPRLMDVVERSFPSVRAYANEAAMKAHETGFTAQIALGSLGLVLRNEDSDFPRTRSYLKADPDRVSYWRDKFRIAGEGPIIGVAWAGGTKTTRAYQRTLKATDLSFAGEKAVAVSLQYGRGVQADAEAAGFKYYPELDGQDMEAVFAAAAACDIIITVAQTIVHCGGALGVPTYVLTPLYSSWRYGQRSEMLWYSDNVRLLRQHRDGDWTHPLKRAKTIVEQLCESHAK